MNEETIKTLIQEALQSNSETDSVEFKDARGGFPSAPVKKTLSAFANTSGGVIVFGIEEDSNKELKVVGVENTSVLQEATTNITNNDMNEVLRLSFYTLDFEGVHVLAVYVPECENRMKPYHIAQLGMHKGAYVRDGNTDRQMSEAEVRDYVRNSHSDDFDGTCVGDVTYEHLSQEKIDHFLTESASRAGRTSFTTDDKLNTLKNIGLIAKCDEVMKATVAGFLLFADDRPQNVLQYERYIIRCVRYKGLTPASDILDKVDIDGTLDEQIDKIQAFILRNIAVRADIIGTKRVERYEYPEKAIREIVANAVIHRDYRITETYTQVAIFADRIEVSNPGNLPPGVTVENIRDAQVTRNRIIAARLKDMDYLEEYGRGIDLVFTEMRKWGLLPPIFKNSSNSFKAILPGETLSKLNERQLQIWQFVLENNRCTSKDIKNIAPDIPSATINYDLRKMVDYGLLVKMGESRNTYYETSF